MSTATVNGIPVSPIHKETILEVCERLGIHIPTLCHGPGKKPCSECRLCLVESKDHPHPVAACHTLFEPGMVIETHSQAIESLRSNILSLYRDTSTLRDGVAMETSDTFRALLEEYHISPPPPPAAAPSNRPRHEEKHPYLRFDPTTCIHCRLCLNTCEHVQGQFVFSLTGRGADTRISIGEHDTFHDSPCVACGACVDVCPTGAIDDIDCAKVSSTSSTISSICGFCGVGCRIEADVDSQQVVRIKGAPSATVNHGHLCAKGRYTHSYLQADDRLKKPLIRRTDGLHEVGWDEALEYIVQKFKGLIDHHGPDSLGTFTSSRSTNESCYLLQKFFREVIGTNNVDCCARVCHASTALALQLVTGTGAASASYEDIEQSRCIVVAGANPTEAHPVIGARIKQRAMQGVPLIVIDPRKIELADYATVHLQLTPGTNVCLFNGLAKLLIENGTIDTTYLTQRVDGFETLVHFLTHLSLDEVERTTGLSRDLLDQASSLMGQCHGSLFVHGLGLSELEQGTASVMTLCNLGMLTGSIGRLGSGMLPLRGQNNVQGSADMGSMPNNFTGYQSISDAGVRAHLETIWEKLPPEHAGLTIPEMVDAAAAGSLHGLWIQGEDIVQSDPNESHVIEALNRLDFLVIQELFHSETCRYADVILPAASYLEQDGTFTNGERRIQRVRPAVPAPGEARQDWCVIRDVARMMGAEWNYQHPSEVMDEIARVAPKLFGGIRYHRLGDDGLQWPCPTLESHGTACVHADGFMRGKGQLVALDHTSSSEHDIPGFPYLLITGRVLEHYNVGTMTRRSQQTELLACDYLEIHPADAQRDDIKEGEPITIQSRWGKTCVPVKHSLRMAPGTLFLSFHFPESHTNRLTGPAVDPQSKCPQYKATAVRLLP
ncbi:MAG: formate dehydrogenase subunit alpha [Verrucomicrobiae bacterium]|nr:formate dehydrogenase subunit alpha [Verrucomicrobiae bacterium]NNJ43761.1 formate dehydrogenase subunit alpha [Akkermansiaceae bacterium]